MARGSLTEDERHCFDANAKSQEKNNGEAKPNGLRVRFLDEEGKTERTVSADEVDCAVSRVKNIHILKNRSSSETSLFLRNPSLAKRVTNAERRLSDGNSDKINNNNSSNENLNGKIMLKFSEFDNDYIKTDSEQNTKETSGHYKKNCNVYSVNQAKTLSAERRKSIPMSMPRLMSKSNEGVRSMLPAEGSLAEAAAKDFATRTLGRLSRGLGRLLRRTNSVRISEPDPVFKVAYLGNVLTGWARGESCIEKPLATLWRNYQQSSKPDVVMKLSVTNSGLKGFTKEHGLTEYWSHRITYCASPPHYPRLFCWVYRHEGKKLKHELRCHAVLCTKESVSKKITEELQMKLKQALQEFKKDRICKQNARLSLANSVYDNPSMPRRKILLSVGATNYRPPLERSKSAPKLGAIEELCSEEDEEEAEMNVKQELCGEWSNSNEDFTTQTLDRRRNVKSPRKYSCPDGFLGRTISNTNKRSSGVSDDIINLLVNGSSKKEIDEASQYEGERFHRLESIDEKNEMENVERNKIIMQSNYLVTDSDDGSVSSGCETASTAASDSEPTSLPSHFQPEEQIKEESELVTEIITAFERMQNYDLTANTENHIKCSDDGKHYEEMEDEVNHVPIGENNTFRRRSTYPPLGTDSNVHTFESKYESLTDTMTDFDSMNSADADHFKNSGDNESACSDESGYSELLENGKDSIIGNTIMV